jgi:serine O-acetyltransferase
MTTDNIINLLKSDLNRYYQIDGRSINPSLQSKVQLMLFSYGLHAIMVYRLGQYLKKYISKNVLLNYVAWPLYLVLNKFMHILYGIYISPEASIEGGLYIGHLGGIRINNCVIGKNCSVHQQTTIGTYENDKERPLIGDYVWIGAHSCINNNIIIDDHATIAAGSVVTKNVKERTLVMGNPARVSINNYNNQFLLGINSI